MKVWNRLWVRLTLAFTLITLIAVGAIAVLINRTTGTEFRRYITHSEMRASGSGMQQLAGYYQQQGSWEGIENLLAEGIFVSGPMGMPMPGMEWRTGRLGERLDVMLADANGKIVFDSAEKATGKRLNTRERDSALPITSLDDDEQVIGYLLLSFSGGWDRLGELERSFLDRMQTVLITAVTLMVGLGLIASALLSRSLTAPLQRLVAAARAVAGGDLGQRVQVEGSAEIAEAGQAFNEMTSALQEGERLRQNMVADVAHELRTPLTVLQGNLRALLDDVYPLEKVEIARLYDETRLLSRLVDDLRELAQAEAGQLSFSLRPTDVSDVIQTTVANFEPAAAAKSIHLTMEVTAELPSITADPDRLALVLRNLLINALRHTPEGGQVTVSSGRAEDGIHITVTDNGEGLAPEDVPHVFDRFWRADRSRSRAEGSISSLSRGGAGLGLAIVRAMVEAHGGRVSAASDGPGQGSTFTVWLPLDRQ